MNETFPITFSDMHNSRIVNCNSSIYPDYTQTYTWKWNYQNSRSGSDNPYWRRTVQEGGDATTNFSGVKHKLHRYSPGYVFIRYATCPAAHYPKTRETSGIESSRVCVVSPIPGSSGTAALNQAKTWFVKEARKHINPFQGMVVLGEIHKTLRMIKQPLHSLVKDVGSYHEKLKKISPRLSSEHRKKALTDTYLESVYGWTPLLADIEAGRQLLGVIRKTRAFEVIPCKGMGKTAFAMIEEYETPFNHISFLNTDLVTEEYSYLIKGGIRVEPVGCDPLAAAGFSFESFLPSAWELLPYSFLADYVANIGDIIDAWSLVNGRLAWCSLNSRLIQRRKSIKIEINPAYTSNASSVQHNPGFHEFSKKTMSRSKLVSVIPDFGFRLPGFGSKQSLNTAVLALRKTVKTPFY